ncbi:MAG: PASTA domain-containing protein [Candidatus Zixiibacteriota bacterium]|nr:MAG: PASTA domain-containing protein [candidate division Zixibacteria bacterium]
MIASLKQWGLAVLLALLFFSTLLLAMDKVILPMYTRHNQIVEVPEVVEMQLEEAEKTLKRAGFILLVEAEKYDDHYPAGTIINQNPEAFTETKPGRRVYVTISSGERLIIMPNLVGKAERDAFFTATAAGLTLREEDVGYEYSFYYPAGVIMSQSIPAGTSLNKDTRIHVTSSLGKLPEEFTIPNLVGQPLDRARKILLTSGLTVGEVKYIMHQDLLPNTVMKQTPNAGRPAEAGQPVELVVSALKGEQP